MYFRSLLINKLFNFKNAPFGRSNTKNYEDYKISGIDEQMVVNALSSIKDDGRASIIIVLHIKYKDNGTLAAQKASINYLYEKFNAVDIINIIGGLYFQTRHFKSCSNNTD